MASLVLCMLVFVISWVSECASLRICFSCTDLQEKDTCQHVIVCEENEICFTQKYKSRNNETLYSLGCTYPELCRKDNLGSLFGKRNTDHSHVLCHKCCDGTACNSELKCFDDYKDSSLTCLACSGVESPITCTNTTECEKDEECYIHKYKANNDRDLYDLGCKHSYVCYNRYHHYDKIIGKRTDSEVHLTCESCCSDFSFCNQNLNCNHTNPKKFNESCLSNSECSSNLICTLGKCICPTLDYFWSIHTCKLRKSVGQQCRSTMECSDPLQCQDNICKCPGGQYWSPPHCKPKKSITEKCQSLDECMETLFCVHGVCKCDKIDIWSGHSCTPKNTYEEACLTNNDCHESESCINYRCECFQSHWNGKRCQKEIPFECADVDFIISGVYTIYPSGNQSVDVYCVIEDGVKWTVFQRRVDGSEHFNRTWYEYEVGFGNYSREFWIGNDLLHSISSHGRHRLRIDMTSGGQKYYAIYSNFRVESEADKYRLTVSGYSGTAGDSLDNVPEDERKSNGMKFSTHDSDNDMNNNFNCASHYRSGWWHNSCFRADLNIHPGTWHYNIRNDSNIDTSMMMMTRV